MRALIIVFALLAAPLLRAQGMVGVNPAQPRVDGAASFTLSGVVPFSVTWNFGDGTQAIPGGSVITHTFFSAGTFIVRATYTVGSLGGVTTTVQRAVSVVEPRRIRYSPAAPGAGQPVTLQTQGFFATGGIRWEFGDGSAPTTTDTTSVVHAFPRQGVFTVGAMDTSGAVIRVIPGQVVVGPTGPSAPFSIAYLALRWEDGTLRRTVVQGETGLSALADLKFEGTGLLQAQWLVDGAVFRTFSQQLAFANRVTLSSGPDSMPTGIPGEHRVSLRVIQPTLSFEVPVIRYFVSLGPDPEGPVLKGILPKRVRAGEEVELQISGLRLGPDMELHLGRDVAPVGPLRLMGPGQALVRVFVAPSARPGIRIVRSSRPKGGPAGTARLEVLPLRKSRRRP